MRLLVAYNAEGGLIHGALDWLHKTLSPASYGCDLCRITYGPLGMRRAWAETLASTGLEPLFLHREDLPPAHPALPFLALGSVERPELLVSADDLRQLDLAGLRSLLVERLAERGIAAKG